MDWGATACKAESHTRRELPSMSVLVSPVVCRLFFDATFFAATFVCAFAFACAFEGCAR